VTPLTIKRHHREVLLHRPAAHATSSTMESAHAATPSKPRTPCQRRRRQRTQSKSLRHRRTHISTPGVTRFTCYRPDQPTRCKSTIGADKDTTYVVEVAGSLWSRGGLTTSTQTFTEVTTVPTSTIQPSHPTVKPPDLAAMETRSQGGSPCHC
jgi:hypothetical protein